MFRKIGFQFTVSRREVSSTHSFRIRRKHLTQHFEHVQNFSAYGMRMKMAVEPSGALRKLQGEYLCFNIRCHVSKPKTINSYNFQVILISCLCTFKCYASREV
jgi:hypothetical protein